MSFKGMITSIWSKSKCKVKNSKIKIKQFISGNDVELTMIVGLFFILFATYKVNLIAFLYVLGFVFLSFSVYLLKFPSRGGDK